ncbi:hypothetical protein [Streptomyces sp. NPDC050145]|uniref:hypothetical protein n=1 Tax=Streptomyces sp. NPDC050145 TaxID=3365602 RepID=UPI00378FA436
MTRAHVHSALLALDDPDKPWRIRAGQSGADIVAEWHMIEPAWGRGRDREQTERRFKFVLRLDESAREARVLAHVHEVTRRGKNLRWVAEKKVGRGPRTRVWSKKFHWEKDAEGRRQRVYSVDFDSNYMRDPMQKVVLGSGWTWRGVHRLT